MPTEAIIIDIDHIEPGDKVKIKNITNEEVIVKQKFNASMLPKSHINTASIEPIINNFRNRIENPETSSPMSIN